MLIQHLIAWSNYEDDLRDYSIEIFDPEHSNTEQDYYNADHEQPFFKKQVKIIEISDNDHTPPPQPTELRIWSD